MWRWCFPLRRGVGCRGVVKGVWASWGMFFYELSAHCSHPVSSEPTPYFSSHLVTNDSYSPGESKSSAEVGDWWTQDTHWHPAFYLATGQVPEREVSEMKVLQLTHLHTILMLPMVQSPLSERGGLKGFREHQICSDVCWTRQESLTVSPLTSLGFFFPLTNMNSALVSLDWRTAAFVGSPCLRCIWNVGLGLAMTHPIFVSPPPLGLPLFQEKLGSECGGFIPCVTANGSLEVKSQGS